MLKSRTQKIAKNSPTAHNRTTLSGYIFAIKAHIDNWKNFLSINISPICPDNMVNFGPLAAEIRSLVWGTPAISTGSRLGSVTARHSSIGCQPSCAALNRGRHLYSAGRPSRWALAHILVPSKFVCHYSEIVGLSKIECGPMSNVMAALQNINGALCSTPQHLADAHYSSAVQ